MIIDTHCHFDMMSQPEAYIRQKELAGDIVIGMTNLPSHFEMGFPYVKEFRHIRLALGLHPLLATESKKEMPLFKRLVNQTSYIGEIGLDFSKEGISSPTPADGAVIPMISFSFRKLGYCMTVSFFI